LSKQDRLEEIILLLKNLKEIREGIMTNLTTRKTESTTAHYKIPAGYYTGARRPVRDLVKYLDQSNEIMILLMEELFNDLGFERDNLK